MKGKKTKNLGVLETLRLGPDLYGPNEHQRECVKEAAKMLMEAKEPLEYRKTLLDAYVSFHVKQADNDNQISN